MNVEQVVWKQEIIEAWTLVVVAEIERDGFVTFWR